MILPTIRRTGLQYQKSVCRQSVFPDLNHFSQVKNYQLLVNPNCALMVDCSSDVSRKQTVD